MFPTPPRCATCAYYTRVTLSMGLCTPPTSQGGEPFPIQCRAAFIACHMYKPAKQNTK